MLWSPCGGCDPHLAAAVLCYLSFFLSGCSFFLYWYWLVSYRDEQNPSGTRYADQDSDCEHLDVDNPHAPEVENEEEEDEPFHRSSRDCEESREEAEEDRQVPCSSSSSGRAFRENGVFVEEEKGTKGLSGSGGGQEGVKDEPVACSSSNNNNSSSGDRPVRSRRKCFSCPGSRGVKVSGSRSDSCKETLLPSCESDETQSSGGGEESVVGDSDRDNVDTGISSDGHDEVQEGDLREEEDYEGNDLEEDCPSKSEVSNNPYLNGDTYSQNMLWGLHGVFTNLIEAILACVFYSGLFENNLLTSLVWLVGFGTNFLVGNFLYILLLVYCTNKAKSKELRIRWALESTFNIAKDVYYLWVGAALLDHIITV